MEYLMTYGWAILIVIIVAAALYALGVFNPVTTSSATGFPNFIVPAGGWQYVNVPGPPVTGTLTLQIRNAAGGNIAVTAVDVLDSSGVALAGTQCNSPNAAGALCSTGITMGPNAQQTFIVSAVPNVPTASSSYSLRVKVTYDNTDSGLTGFSSVGTLTGTVG